MYLENILPMQEKSPQTYDHFQKHRDEQSKNPKMDNPKATKNSSSFSCTECDYVGTKRYVMLHIKSVHKKIKDIVCKECGFATTYRSSLNKHVRLNHGQVRDKRCKFCNYTTSHNGVLRRHINEVHEKIKRHVLLNQDQVKGKRCEFCNYTSGHNGVNGVLRRHINEVHDKIKRKKL
jgi:hypothetical protein